MILFGRRRVGKTSLLTHFMESRHLADGFYWMATTHNATYQLRIFLRRSSIYPLFTAAPAADFTFSDREAAFNHLANAVGQFPTTQFVVLDEFTYLVRNDPALTSLVQKLWDHRFSKIANLRLVLTGSLVGMMSGR